jgi:hypothetical protein
MASPRGISGRALDSAARDQRAEVPDRLDPRVARSLSPVEARRQVGSDRPLLSRWSAILLRGPPGPIEQLQVLSLGHYPAIARAGWPPMHLAVGSIRASQTPDIWLHVIPRDHPQ